MHLMHPNYWQITIMCGCIHVCMCVCACVTTCCGPTAFCFICMQSICTYLQQQFTFCGYMWGNYGVVYEIIKLSLFEQTSRVLYMYPARAGVYRHLNNYYRIAGNIGGN